MATNHRQDTSDFKSGVVLQITTGASHLESGPSNENALPIANHEFQRYPNLAMNLMIERPEQVWVADITYIKLNKEFVYLAILMDVFTQGTQCQGRLNFI
jgi:hypothetical protein